MQNDSRKQKIQYAKLDCVEVKLNGSVCYVKTHDTHGRRTSSYLSRAIWILFCYGTVSSFSALLDGYTYKK